MKKLYSVICILSFLFLSHTGFSQNVIYVTVNGAGNQSGSSWSNAKKGTSLRETMRLAPAYAQIWIAAGTYYPDLVSQDSSFVIPSRVEVYGGFLGNENSLSQRNWVNNKTIFSGDIGIPNDTTDNSFHIVLFHNSIQPILDGVTITLGNANDTLAPSLIRNSGAGILITGQASLGPNNSYISNNCSPRIINCTITKNYSRNLGAGLAIFNMGNVSSYVYNSTFDDNYCFPGGSAVYVDCLSGLTNPTFDSCFFINNQTGRDQDNGTIYLSASSMLGGSNNITIKKSIFDNNTKGACLVNTKMLNLHIDSCIFSNGFGKSVSAIFLLNNGLEGSTKISNCEFYNNKSNFSVIMSTTNGGVAPAMRKDTISNCTFYDKDAGTALYLSVVNGGIDTSIVYNCLFYNNLCVNSIFSNSSDGGKKYTVLDNLTMSATAAQITSKLSNMVNNYAYTSPGAPYGYANAQLVIQNSILNFPKLANQTIKRVIYNSTYGMSGGTASSITRNSLVQINSPVWPTDAGIDGGNNLLNTDAGFMDTLYHNFRLNCHSPAVNAGSTSILPSYINKDLDGRARVFGSNVDMGCYEQHEVPSAIAIPIATANAMYADCHAFSNLSIDSVKWDFGDNTFSDQINVVHTYSTLGNKTICLKVYTQCGSNDSCINVVIDGQDVGIPVANPFSSIVVFPNPVVSMLTIGQVPFSCRYIITSVLGEIKSKGNLNKGENHLKLSQLVDGIYIIRLFHEDGSSYTFKVLKR